VKIHYPIISGGNPVRSCRNIHRNIKAFDKVLAKKRKTRTSIHNKKRKVFLPTLCAFSILVQFSKIKSYKPGCARYQCWTWSGFRIGSNRILQCSTGSGSDWISD